MDAARLHAEEGRLEQRLWATEALVANGDDLHTTTERQQDQTLPLLFVVNYMNYIACTCNIQPYASLCAACILLSFLI